MIVVISFNLFKLLIMLWILFTDKSDYLVMLGDAAASFLERPDPFTLKECMLGKDEILRKRGHRTTSSTSSRTDGYLRAPSPRLLCLCAANLAFPVCSMGLSAWGTSSQSTMSTNNSILFNAWIVNLPQVILSFCYLGLNNICTFLASVEVWNNLALSRKGLRVTKPMAEQRSTYFLQLPFRWSVPLIVTSGVLHWLLSQTFFQMRVDVFERDSDTRNADKSKSVAGYSSLSLLVFFIVALALVVAVGWVAQQYVQQRLPMAASCSLDISAACHPPQGETDTHLKKVKWGLVGQQGQGGDGTLQFICWTGQETKG
ncbi:hypothetical protein T440DRAFT_542799 [Plenodomus tracheiphilus IPT5]|uniref:Uncharacterized protein n=1 Tax=Plenodomus tracheiphilus IPT5 TaxID=1408161 RepID=A0A6A7ATQ2_9PLEO|nr:hypothetical protein T440DRAFT_542799 [Plenodomus tracheiphilus IPT5]